MVRVWFCVNLVDFETPSSSFDHHQKSAQSWLSKTHQQDLDLMKKTRMLLQLRASLPPPPPSQFLGWDLLSWDLSSLLDPLNLTWARISLILHEKSKSSLPLLLQSWITWSKSRTGIRNKDFWINHVFWCYFHVYSWSFEMYKWNCVRLTERLCKIYLLSFWDILWKSFFH